MVGKVNNPVPVRRQKYNVYPETQSISPYVSGIGEFSLWYNPDTRYVLSDGQNNTIIDTVYQPQIPGQTWWSPGIEYNPTTEQYVSLVTGQETINPQDVVVAAGIGAAVGMLVNPILGLAAGFLYYQAAKKPGSVHSQG